MKLSFEDIKRITVGAVSVKEENGGITFHRFTDEQEEFFKALTERSYARALCPAGVKLRFKTDSKSLFFKATVEQGSDSKWACFDIHINGRKLYSLCNFVEDELPIKYSAMFFPLGEMSGSFELGDGEKTVEIYMPHNQHVTLSQLSLSEGAYLTPVKREKLILSYGDSITQGFHALHPDRRYTVGLCNYFNADELCKAIAGDRFRPEEVEMSEEVLPDYISVAYGTNDWKSNRSKDAIESSCRRFCEILRRKYPSVPIFIITPIWRGNADEIKESGSFDGLYELIKTAVKNIEGVKVIDGRRLVPEERELFGDLVLHPADKGFDHYSENLVKELQIFGY